MLRQMGVWRNWQTRETQNLLAERPSGFESRHPHLNSPVAQWQSGGLQNRSRAFDSHRGCHLT